MLSPMRPGIALPAHYGGPFPAAWLYQVKLDDERAVYCQGQFWNRFGRPFSPAKARVFPAPPFETADLALLGFRGHWEPGAIVVLDLPTIRRPFAERYAMLGGLPVFDPWSMQPVPGTIYRLENFADPAALFARTREVGGLEGIVGRDPQALYVEGDSRSMLKWRWKNA